MVHVRCPWCDELVETALDDGRGEQTCAACQSTWEYETVEPAELPLAA